MEPIMRVTELRRHVDRRPFVPFRIVLSDGSAHAVGHPNLVWVTRDTFHLGVLSDADNLPRTARWIDPMHITSVELLEEQPPEGPEPRG